MTPDFYAGASYPVELVSGEFVRFYERSHFETHLGRVPLPPGEPDGVLALDATTVGGFKFAGLGWSTGVIWEWTTATDDWRAIPGPLTSPVVYDQNGTLLYQPIPSGGSWSSQGYRFVDESGRVWTGDETYGPLHGISQWSRIADLMVGQGHATGGVVVRSDRDGVLRQLEGGECYFIKSHTDGVRAVVSAWKPREGGSVVLRGPLSSLRALPPVETPVPPPTPTPGPPILEPTVSRKDELFPILQALNTDPAFALGLHGTPEATKAHSIRFLSEGVRRARARGLTRWGLLQKPSGINGDNVTSLEDNGVILHFDAISGADGVNEDGSLTYMPTLTWGDNGPIQPDWSQFIPDAAPAPVPQPPVPQPGPAPVPPLPPVPPSDVIASILRRLDALEGPRTMSVSFTVEPIK